MTDDPPTKDARSPEERDQLYAQDGLYSKDHPVDSPERPDKAGPHPARERPDEAECP